MLLQRELAP